MIQFIQNHKLLTGLSVALGGFLILGYLGISYSIKHILPYSAIRPARIITNNSSPSLMSNLFKLHYEKFNVWTKDSIELKGWFVYTHLQPAKGTIFLLHGIGDSKTSMIPMAVKFASEGYNCILFDHRAHGESTGINCTFGYYEKFDYQTIIDSAIVRYPHSQPYGFFGNSLGAAITVQVMSIDRRIKAGVVQSCFGNLRETIHDYFKKITYISLPWIVDKALIETEKIANFSVDSVKPEIYAHTIIQPIMIVHGLNDDRINYQYGKRVFDNISSSVKIWYPIYGADHNNISEIDGSKYYRTIRDFYTKNLH